MHQLRRESLDLGVCVVSAFVAVVALFSGAGCWFVHRFCLLLLLLSRHDHGHHHQKDRLYFAFSSSSKKHHKYPGYSSLLLADTCYTEHLRCHSRLQVHSGTYAGGPESGQRRSHLRLYLVNTAMHIQIHMIKQNSPSPISKTRSPFPKGTIGFRCCCCFCLFLFTLEFAFVSVLLLLLLLFEVDNRGKVCIFLLLPLPFFATASPPRGPE